MEMAVKNLLKALAAFVTLFLSASAFAATAWQEGVNYSLVENMPRSGAAPGQIEVVEVFSYGCPACNVFAPTVRKLRQSLPANVKFGFVPASFNVAEDWPMLQRAFCTAQLLGVADKTHDAMFDAIWKTGELSLVDPSTGQLKHPLPTIEDAARFYNKHAGVKVADFVAMANSMSIDIKMKDADAYVRLYRVDHTPTIVVNNKYRTDPQMAGGNPQLVELVTWLVAKETKK